eukprot:Rmarinus@m.23005
MTLRTPIRTRSRLAWPACPTSTIRRLLRRISRSTSLTSLRGARSTCTAERRRRGSEKALFSSTVMTSGIEVPPLSRGVFDGFTTWHSYDAASSTFHAGTEGGPTTCTPHHRLLNASLHSRQSRSVLSSGFRPQAIRFGLKRLWRQFVRVTGVLEWTLIHIAVY